MIFVKGEIDSLEREISRLKAVTAKAEEEEESDRKRKRGDLLECPVCMERPERVFCCQVQMP